MRIKSVILACLLFFLLGQPALGQNWTPTITGIQDLAGDQVRVNWTQPPAGAPDYYTLAIYDFATGNEHWIDFSGSNIKAILNTLNSDTIDLEGGGYHAIFVGSYAEGQVHWDMSQALVYLEGTGVPCQTPDITVLPRRDLGNAIQVSWGQQRSLALTAIAVYDITADAYVQTLSHGVYEVVDRSSTSKIIKNLPTTTDYYATAFAIDWNGSIAGPSTFQYANLAEGFLSPPTLAPHTLYVGEASDIISALTNNDPIDVTLKLWLCSEGGSPSEQIATMYDDGDLNNHGDDIPGDGVFHGKFSVTPANETDLFYIISDSAETRWSAITRLAVVPEISDESLNTAAQEATTAATTYDDVIKDGGSISEALAALQNYLATLDDIAEQGASGTGLGTWWVTNDGVLCIHEPNSDSTTVRSGGNSTDRNPDPLLPEYLIGRKKPILPTNYPSLEKCQNRTIRAMEENIVESKEALLLRVFNFGTDELPEIQASLDNLCFSTTLIDTGHVTLDHFKNLNQYGVFATVGHGDTYYKGLWTLWKEEWGSEKGSAQCVMNTSIDRTDAMKKDISAGRLVVTAGNKVAILPSFIKHYNSALPNSLIYIGTCRSARNSSLADAFLNAGASTYFGYTDYVGTLWAEARGENLFDHLDDGKTAGSAPEIGMIEPEAEFKMYGDGSLLLVGESGVSNGDFEKGTLSGWDPEGDCRVITSLQTLSPPEGTYMAIVSSGLSGGTQLTVSILKQKLSPTADKHTLKFRYDVVSEEPMEWVGSIFNDKFELIIDGNVTLLESVNGSTWVELGGNYFYGGDETTYHTGWKDYTLDLNAYVGSCIEVQFKVYDEGDSIYDTAALLDNIRLE